MTSSSETSRVCGAMGRMAVRWRCELDVRNVGMDSELVEIGPMELDAIEYS